MGLTLLAHHSVSEEAFTKDKTEYALVRIYQAVGIPATKSPRTFPGQDITVNGVRISVKSQADANISPDELHISKYMELGKGEWVIAEQRDRMLAHLTNYERILDMRCLSKRKGWTGPAQTYELVEIPKALLLRAADAVLTIDAASRQTPKPGHGRVYDARGRQLYELYFDAGTERKLQIRHLLKSECIVHGTWAFNLA